MHYYLLIMTPTKLDTDRAIALVSRPSIRGKFGADWCQIGGRWSGILDPNYDPEKDPRNIDKKCWLCAGTGKRLDMEVENGCNGCRGLGWKVKWPTEWVDVPGNYALAAELLDRIDADAEFAKKITPWGFVFDGEASTQEEYPGRPDWSTFHQDQEKWREQYNKWEEDSQEATMKKWTDALAQAAAKDYYVTVVDIHS